MSIQYSTEKLFQLLEQAGTSREEITGDSPVPEFMELEHVVPILESTVELLICERKNLELKLKLKEVRARREMNDALALAWIEPETDTSH